MYFRALLCFQFTLLCSVPAVAQFSGLTTSGSPVVAPAQLQKLPDESTDKALENLLKSIFAKTPSMADVKVDVSSGVVYYEGFVQNQKDSEWMLAVANRLPNVIAITNRTTIQGISFDGPEPMWGELNRLSKRFMQHLPSLVFALVFFAIVFFSSSTLTRWVTSILARKINNTFLLSVVTRITLLPIFLLLFYFGLRMLGLSTLGATLIGGTSVLGIVLGLAFKGIAENYLAGLLLASRSPFTRGDIIKIGEYQGYVENLNMRGTTIIDLNGNLILIPNLTVIQSVVENRTANPKTRTSFKVGIGYQDSIARAQDLIIKSISQVDGVLLDPQPNVVVSELGSMSVVLNVYVWFDSKKNRELRVRSRAMTQTKEALLANGFSIPGEAREMIFTNSLKVEKFERQVSEEVELRDRNSTRQANAERNLAEPESRHASEGPSPEEMLKQAEQNPLPTNSSPSVLPEKK